jgi:Flp pilus assembly pilin Flp
MSTSSIVSEGSKALGNRLGSDERGAALIEQALLIFCLITLTVLGFVIAVSSWANGAWDQILR